MNILDQSFRGQINLSCDVEKKFDLKSLDFHFLIEKRESISDFSYKFLSNCWDGSGAFYFEDEQIEIYKQTKSRENIKVRTFGCTFGFSNDYYYWVEDNKHYDYWVDLYLENLKSKGLFAISPIKQKALYMVAMNTQLNSENKCYWRPLYIGQTDNFYQRWKIHHRREQFNFLSQLDIELHLFVYFCYEEEVTPQELIQMEKELITNLNPLMNGKPVLKKRKNIVMPNNLQGKVFPNSIFPSQNDIG